MKQLLKGRRRIKGKLKLIKRDIACSQTIKNQKTTKTIKIQEEKHVCLTETIQHIRIKNKAD